MAHQNEEEDSKKGLLLSVETGKASVFKVLWNHSANAENGGTPW